MYFDGIPHNPSCRDWLRPCRYFYVDPAGVLQKSPNLTHIYDYEQTIMHNEKKYIVRYVRTDTNEKIRVLFRKEDKVWFWGDPFRIMSKKEKKKINCLLIGAL